MIGYMMMGTNDLEKAAAFYDQVLAELGGQRAMVTDRFVGYSNGQGAMFAIVKPNDGKPATVGNGTMAAFAASSRDAVNAAYKKALELGATDEGAPGERGTGFYGAYFRDLDGNKLNAFIMKMG